MKKIFILLSVLVLTLIPSLMFGGETISGIVFDDSNKNGILDANEIGIKGVPVSNQLEVVLTNDDGEYILPVRDRMIVFVSKPSGYDLPLDELNLPQFYYIHSPEGSPDSLRFSGVKPTGNLPKKINFPLIKTKEQIAFNVLIVGDPQPYDSIQVGYFRDDIITKMVGKKVSFYMAMGDISGDNLNTYKQYNAAVSQLEMPAYNVPGNHDMNYRVDSDDNSMETFTNTYGPPTYSFNYGKVHFIILDDVEYFGWNSEKNRHGGYQGFVNKQQLKWLENDLKYVPEDYLILLATHIPIVTIHTDSKAENIVNRKKLFDILSERKHLLAISGHLHYLEHFDFDKNMGWKGKAKFPSINVGAACGAWWSGPKTPLGIPQSFCMDGSPNGFFIFEFEGNKFNQRFIPAKYDENYQMRFTSPIGTIKQTVLDTTQIIVNIFNADPTSDVYCKIDNGNWTVLTNPSIKDPFMLDYIEQNREVIPRWANVVTTDHVWKTQLPKELEKGTHTIKVIAKDKMGNSYSGVQIFEIE